MPKNKKQKVLVIVGPTCSGKSELAVHLARKFNGEVVSADSRQVYRGLNIGAGKITKKEMRGIPHHLLDVASPRRQFNVARYRKLAERAVQNILHRGKLPIICGGTGFYIQAIIDKIIIPDVPPDQALRRRLDKKSSEEILEMLKVMDLRRAINIDPRNKRRLIRAVEIARALGKVPPLRRTIHEYNTLIIGLRPENKDLREKIKTRLNKRLKQGLIAEVRQLKNQTGLSFRRLEELGLEYRFVALFLQNRLNKKEMANKLEKAISQYARRQKTWFKRDKWIKWFPPGDYADMEQVVKNFLTNGNSYI